jgi:peptidyl-prolyl cis-trans isomerase C
MRGSASSLRQSRILAGYFAVSVLAVLPAAAQNVSDSNPSPLAPGDLSKPVFDTAKPVYDSLPSLEGSLEKNAATMIAEVEGRPITLGNIGDALQAVPPVLRQASYDVVLRQLILQQALVVRAQQQGVDEEPAIRRKMREASDTVVADGYLTREINKTIEETELLARYERDFAGKPGEDEVRARIILTGTEAAANDLMTEIRGGADFATVARRASRDTTAPAGGDLGFATREQMNPEIGAVAFSLAPGQMAAYPVRSANVWFVVKTEERRVQPTPTFAEVRERMAQTLLREKVAAVSEAALKGMAVRWYNMDGKERDAVSR